MDNPISNIQYPISSPQSPIPSPPFRIDTLTGIDDLWQPDTAAIYGLEDVGGIVNPLGLRHWQELWNALGGRHTQLYDMLNVRYVIVRDDVPLPEKFILAFDAPGPLAVYENPDAFPRAWLVEDAITADDPLAAIQSTEFDPARVVILAATDAAEDDGRGTTDDAAADSGPQTATGALRTPQLELEVHTSAPAHLVLSQVWYPGWRATVNGEDAPVLRANHALRAVPVPAGASTVRLWFAPASWRWGLGLSGAGMVALLGLVGVYVRNRYFKRSRPPGEKP